MRVAIGLVLLAACAWASAQTPVAQLDPSSRFDFVLTTRWGQDLQGRFGPGSGEVRELPDGRRQVRLRIDARTVEILDHPRYTAITRGPRFFDVARYPDLQFHSDPYSPQLLRDGGALHGVLRIHGVQRRARFELQPSTCANPGRDCDIVGTGSVRRGDFDLDGWRVALRDEVRFQLRVRTQPLTPEAVP
jgi:polyisoprenoid-binding protein YceI